MEAYTDALFTIENAYLKLRTSNEKYAKSVGVNFETILVLYLLHDTDKIYNQKELCTQLRLPKQFINAIIKSLWEQSYVQLIESKDRRYKRILLTEEGKQYAVKLLSPYTQLEGALADYFSAERLLMLAADIEKYMDAYDRVLNGIT
jgi:DNA-binding MarR family transcriptional regulator